MSIGRLVHFSKDGRVRKPQWEMWFIYLARCMPLPNGGVFVKVGISSEPFNRLATVHASSPMAIDIACFAPVGDKAKAAGLERRVVNFFGERRTRGEWALIGPEDWETLVRDVSAIYQKKCFYAPKWRATDQAAILAGGTAEKWLAGRNRRG